MVDGVHRMYAAAPKTTRKLNMLPETELAPELVVDFAGSAVALSVAVLVAALVAEAIVEALSGFSNRMCGMNPVGDE